MERRTLYTMFEETVQGHGARPAARFKKPKDPEYTTYTYAELSERVQAFRRGLDSFGLRKGDRIALISHENRVEWAIADLAAQSLGLITVPIYGTLPAAQVAYYIRDSGARAFVVSDSKQRAKLREFRSDIPTLELVIAMEGEPEKLEAENILSFDAVAERGRSQGRERADLDAIASDDRPG